MGYTNKTSHYDLPQWIAGDKPSWLGDVNTAMLNIDTAIAGADASATAAESSAAAANAQVQAQEAKITKNTTDIQALTEQVADVSGVANAALPKNGGTMTGALTLAGAPTQDLQAATKKYVDDKSNIISARFIGATAGSVGITIKKIGDAYNIAGYAAFSQTISSVAVVASVAGNPFNLGSGGAILTSCGVDLDSPPENISQLIAPILDYDASSDKTTLSVNGITASHHYIFVG